MKRFNRIIAGMLTVIISFTTIGMVSVSAEETMSPLQHIGDWFQDRGNDLQNTSENIAGWVCDRGDDIQKAGKAVSGWTCDRVEDVQRITGHVYVITGNLISSIDYSKLTEEEYYLDSIEKFVKGDYSDKDQTILSIALNIAASVANVDLALDARDISYDLMHLKEEDVTLVRVMVDGVAILPVIGVIKHVDEISDGVKAISKAVDAASDMAKSTDLVSDVAKVADETQDIKYLVVLPDEASDIIKAADNTDNAADAAKAVDKTEDIIDTAHDVGKKGGRYADIFKKGEGSAYEVNHIPADSITDLSKNDGPAIKMTIEDHRLTASWGASKEAVEYRKLQKKLIDEGRFREAVQMDIDDITSKFPGKYDDAINEMMEYVEWLISEGKING